VDKKEPGNMMDFGGDDDAEEESKQEPLVENTDLIGDAQPVAAAPLDPNELLEMDKQGANLSKRHDLLDEIFSSQPGMAEADQKP
jgi:hypothetical protein